MKQYKVKITGTGMYVPQQVIQSRELEARIGYSEHRQPGWIEQRTGIKERRWRTDKDTLFSMGIEAADMALRNAKANSFDTIVVGRTRYSEPESFLVAGTIHQGLKDRGYVLPNVDYAEGFFFCSGSLSALYDATIRIATGNTKRALVISPSINSAYVNYHHPKTACLWGDGAGAWIVEQAEEPGVLIYSGKGFPEYRNAFYFQQMRDEPSYIDMDARAVYRAVVANVPTFVKETLDKANCKINDIRLFLFHQANRRLLEEMCKTMDISDDRTFTNVEKYGNTSAASLPILYHDAKQSGKMKEGDICVLVGFGAGFHINCMVYKE